VSLAFAHAALGEQDAAVARLERAFDEKDPQLTFIRLLQRGWWDPVLADARVQAIARKMGLPG